MTIAGVQCKAWTPFNTWLPSPGRWTIPRCGRGRPPKGSLDATFQSNMVGLYYLLHAAVEAGVRCVVMAGSNCALGHGYRISQTPFPCRRCQLTNVIRRIQKIPTVIRSWQANCC